MPVFSSRFSASKNFKHEQPGRTAVLLIQLGTPSAPETGAVRKYLAQFLADRRVVEIPRLIWMLILHGIILNVRPKKSAEKYKKVWMPDGSPLQVYTARQASLLKGYLGQAGQAVEVAYAMRYGEPSVASVMRKLREHNVERLLVVPLYPQYSGATTASSLDAVFAELRTWRNIPELRTVKHFHRHEAYLNALARHIESQWQRDRVPDKLVISFHGMPKRTLLEGDPYHCECLVTGRLLAEKLDLRKDQYEVTFQSRFGKAEWLQPYTDKTLEALGKQKLERVEVVCPGFVADCLETLEEIAIEGKETFIHAGGKEFRYSACLNDSPEWISALAKIVLEHMAGWPVQRVSAESAMDTREELQLRKQRATELGARA